MTHGYAHSMQVSIRLFAGAARASRHGRARRSSSPTARPSATSGRALELGDEPSGLLYAVNKRYAETQTALAEGDEVALIPPVSGGDFRLRAEPLSLDAVVREVQRDEAGAIATFIGTVAQPLPRPGGRSTSSTRPTRGWPRRRWPSSRAS